MRKILAIILFFGVLFGEDEIFIKVDGMHCPLCTNIVRKASLKVSGVSYAKADLKSRSLHVKGENIDVGEILKSIAATGYPGVVENRSK